MYIHTPKPTIGTIVNVAKLAPKLMFFILISNVNGRVSFMMIRPIQIEERRYFRFCRYNRKELRPLPRRLILKFFLITKNLHDPVHAPFGSDHATDFETLGRSAMRVHQPRCFQGMAQERTVMNSRDQIPWTSSSVQSRS